MNADRRALHRAPASPRADVAGHVPRKRFGQHFLADRAVLAAIVSAIERVLAEGPRTRDMGGTASTADLGRAIAAAL